MNIIDFYLADALAFVLVQFGVSQVSCLLNVINVLHGGSKVAIFPIKVVQLPKTSKYIAHPYDNKTGVLYNRGLGTRVWGLPPVVLGSSAIVISEARLGLTVNCPSKFKVLTTHNMVMGNSF